MKLKLTLLVAVLLSVPLVSQAFQYEGLEYNVLDEEAATVEVGRNRGATGDIVIPAVVMDGEKSYSVTSIGDEAFYYCSSLASVSIPEGVTSIGDSAFFGCSSLASVSIPEGVTSIGSFAFGSSVTNLTCPISLISLLVEKTNFKASVLNLTLFGDGDIPADMLQSWAKLESVIIPEGVTSIGERAFYGCSSLESVNIPMGVTSLDYAAFADCHSLASVSIPESVTSIGELAFFNCSSLESVSIPEGVTSIGRSVFEDCGSLASVSIPKGVTSIGSKAFYGCKSLASVSIPEGVTSIGDSAFFGCSSLASVSIPEGVASIGRWAFNGCPVTNLTCPISLISQMSDFKEHNLDLTLLGQGDIPDQLFEFWNKLTSVSIREGVTSIGERAFYGCSSLESVSIPESVTSIGRWAFYGCSSLTSVIIPEGVTSINGATFSGCSSLESVSIPESVTSIGDSAFFGCSSLASVSIPEGVTSINWSTFNGCSSLASVSIPESVTSIGGSAFEGCSSLASVIIPEGVTSIDGATFSGCSSLASVSIPESVTSIGGRAFYNCRSLTSVIIPEGVTSIGYSAFYGCRSLTNLVCPFSLMSEMSDLKGNALDLTLLGKGDIPDKLFESWELTSVSIPEGVTSIGEDAFYGCSSLNKAEFGSIQSLCSIEFKDSHANPLALAHRLYVNGEEISELVIPAEFEKIGPYAFYGCSSLASVSIPESVKSIGSSAFNGCTALKDVLLQSASVPNYFQSFSAYVGKAELTIPVGSEMAYFNSPWDAFFKINYGEKSSVRWNDSELTYRLYTSDEEKNPYKAIVASGAYSALKTVTIPDRLTVTPEGSTELLRYYVNAIGYSAFKGASSLESITFNNRADIITVNDHAFDGCRSLTGITLPEGVTSIGAYAFRGCAALQSISIPDGVTSIENDTFNGCNVLTEVSIPEGVTTIGNYAFRDCSALTEVSIPEGVTSISEATFYGCTGLTDIIIPAAVTSIGGSAFYGCTGLTDIIIPAAVRSIGGSAFYGCTGLTDIIIPAAVTSIGRSAFEGCTGLTDIIIPAAVTSIGDYAFYNCSKLTSVTLSDDTAPIEIGANVFWGINDLYLGRNTERSFGVSLKTLTVGNVVTSIPSFAGNSTLSSLTLGSGLTEIPEEAFKNCALTSVVVPANVTAIGAGAFAGNELTKVYMGAEMKTIGENAFDGNPVEEVYVGAITPPEAPTSAFSNYNGNLFVYEASEDDYYEAWTCWDRFNDYKHLVVPTSFTGDNGVTISGEAGNTVRLTATLEPAEVSIPYVFWESSNPDIATVDHNGLVTFHGGKPGTVAECEITAKTLYADVEPVVFNLRGTPTGISEVEVGDGWFGNGGAAVAGDSDIFNLQGVCIKRNASAEDIKALQPGIYIIAGKKTVVR